MKKLLATLLVSSSLIAPLAMSDTAEARAIEIQTQLKKYPGPAAYMAVYLTKPNGAYHSTIAISGSKSKYYPHLRGWYRGVSRAGGRVDGVTGASVGGGRTMTVTTDIADALIEAGYKIHVDTSVEERGDYRSDAVVPLKGAGSATSVRGRGIVKSLAVRVK